MTNSIHTTSESLLVAIDIAKHTHEVILRWPSGRTKAMRVSNQGADFQQFTRFLLDQELSVIAALEPTGDYHRLLAHWLLRHGIQVHLASSLACARVRDALYNSWDKHDRKDARVILYLLEHGLTTPFHDPLLEGYLDLQELSNTYYQIALARSRCYHSLINHYLQLFFPEMERFLHTSRAEWFCRFLLKFPSPTMISELSKPDFVVAAWDVVGRKVAKQRFLEELYEIAAKSVGLPVAGDSMALQTFRLQLKRYLELTISRDNLERQAQELLANYPDSRRLQTLPGVGPIIALMILAESGDLRRFSHHRQYLMYCGFDLSASQSGKSYSRYQLSKRGNGRLRYAFWLAASVAIRQRENSFRWKYERYIRKEPDNADLKRKARTAVAAKMARVAHALIKRGEDYRGYHEAMNSGGGT
jgi:transposase